MTTSTVAYNSYYEHECRWNDTSNNTSVSIAPEIWRWDRYDVYASESWTETLTEPSGSTGSWSGSKSVSTTGGYTQLDTFGTRTYQRRETAYTVTLKFSFNGGSSWSGSYHSVSGTATFTLTISALASYAVTFNANGGSGAPSNQTKYYGKTLTLSSVIPTRAGYNFLGWATSSTATTATYQPGDSYTSNAALALYAVWEIAVVPPTVTLSAYRTASSSSSTMDMTGGYAYLSAVWSKGDHNVSNVQYRYKTDEGSFSGWANCSGTRTGASGTAYKAGIAIAESSYLTVEVKATDGTVTTVTTTVQAVVPPVTFPLYIYDRDKVRIHDLNVESGLVANNVDLLTVEHVQVVAGVDIYKCGHMCTIEISKTVNLSSSWLTVTLGTAAAKYRPSHLVWGVAMSDNNSGLCATIAINTDGAITASNRGGSSIGNQALHGQIVYFV